jgi:DNA-binding MarR family transcriptional regulator
MKQREYRLLEAISEDETVTQAGLAARLDIAVGSVNWYIKRLISRGYIKATRMDRTRLRYNMTAEGIAAFRRNATQYVKDSLKVYHLLRQEAKSVIAELKSQGIQSIYIEGADQELDIFRLSCLESGIALDETPREWTVRHASGEYRLERKTA